MINTREIPWPRILAEGTAVVVSILLAFAIDAWWDERKERDDERDVLLALKAEFEANAQAYLRRIEELCETPVAIISTGPDRAETIILAHPYG